MIVTWVFHSSPSAAALIRGSACAWVIGSSRTCSPSSVMGSTFIFRRADRIRWGAVVSLSVCRCLHLPLPERAADECTRQCDDDHRDWVPLRTELRAFAPGGEQACGAQHETDCAKHQRMGQRLIGS